MTKRDAMPDSEKPAPEIEITAAMIEAGVFQLREMKFGEPTARIAESIYLAMEVERISG